MGENRGKGSQCIFSLFFVANEIKNVSLPSLQDASVYIANIVEDSAKFVIGFLRERTKVQMAGEMVVLPVLRWLQQVPYFRKKV